MPIHHKPSPLRGSCLCSAIAYEVDQLQPKMGHCHCSMCRKFHGAAFTTYGEALAKDFHWLRGENDLSSYRADNGTVRRFCRHCGSSLIFESASATGDVVEFALGSLDTPIEQRPDVHIYTDYKADWYEITDGLPCYREGRSGPKA